VPRRTPVPAIASPNGGVDLPRITPVGRDEWMRWVMFAYPGAGKTSYIATAAAAGLRTLIIRSSVDLIPSRALNSGTEQFVADTWEQMLEILQFFQLSNHPYDWVWWDNISVAEDKLLDDVWQNTVAEKPSRAFHIDKQTGKPGKPNLSPTSGLDKGEFGRNMERIGQWVRHMVGCNSFHFGIMAHPHEGQHPTNDEGGTLLRPYVQGKMMSEKICGYANLVGFMEVLEGDDDLRWRRLHVRESSRWYAKDQYDAFPKGYIDEPTIPKMHEAIKKAMRSSGSTTTTARPGRGRRREQ
jgi:hypothetical protein